MCRSRENKNTAVTVLDEDKPNHAFKLGRAGRQPVSKARGSEKEKKKKYVFKATLYEG